jgi:branched-chain amino acid aminotransferase
MSNTPPFIWFNGKMVPWAEANVHVMTHALHYGSSVFEGVRCYDTPKGPDNPHSSRALLWPVQRHD